MRAAILSTACRYPDAATPQELWKNVLQGRRSFRAIPAERIELARYAAALVGEADSITPVKAGLLTDWRFDRDRFLIPQSTFAATDLVHWLALEVAAEAIGRAGGIDRFDRQRTAVVVANTLTGEFSRASTLRLRLPFLDALLAQAVTAAGLDPSVSGDIRRHFASAIRRRFPSPDAETLAGGLANTIAGRIANFFDLHGGAYTVDGACASSLVALANAADLLALGRVDAVVVGAVDLSLDPFELVGFSRNGALAGDDMRVFDARSSGFWPGEGAAFAVLMRQRDARRGGFRVEAVLRGWGLSTDGAGGLARPSEEGQVLALRRAYESADVDPADVAYIEAHGTGTAVGDPIEVRALAALRNGAARALPIGSIKANIGHTKAAAGFAGLIKAVSALQAGVVPPHVGCGTPHPVFREVDDRVRPALAPEPWPAGAAAQVGVSGFGFGGINAHVVLERGGRSPSVTVVPPPPRPQDVEIFAFAGETADDVMAQIAVVQARASTLSLAEITDAAARCTSELGGGPVRVAIVAGRPDELESKLAQAAAALAPATEIADLDRGIFVARRRRPARIGFLFPGQAAPSRVEGGLWARRFAGISALLSQVPARAGDDPVETAIAQPAIAAASLAGWRILRELAIEPVVVAGHSLGELTALASAGAIAEAALVPLAAARGRAMSDHARPGGGMVRMAASAERVCELVGDLDLEIACDNGPSETVVSGLLRELDAAEGRARRCGLEATRLSVSHAFHSAMIAPAVPIFASVLADVALHPLARNVFSTVLGRLIEPSDDLRDILVRQLVAPVQFGAALRDMAARADFMIEVGPGFGLTRLAQRAGRAASSIDAFGDSLAPLFGAIGAVFAQGVPVQFAPLFGDRPIRPIELAARPRFLASPCGRRDDELAASSAPIDIPPTAAEPVQDAVPGNAADRADVLAAVRDSIAQETGLEAHRIGDDSRFLDHLHLNSFSVARLTARAARALGLKVPASPTEFANATARELAAGLIAARDLAPGEGLESERVAGVRPWVRTYGIHWAERAEPDRSRRRVKWKVVGGAGEEQSLVETLGRHAEPDGLLVWIGAGVDETSCYELFSVCRSGWLDHSIAHLAICHAGAPVAAFARSLAIEARFQSVSVIERPAGDLAIGPTVDELDRDTTGFSEIRIDRAGRRLVPEFRPVTPAVNAKTMLDHHDVVLVTGGAKGIGAECALRIATGSAAALILVGRSHEQDAAVLATLERARAADIRCCYATADVTNAQSLADAIAGAVRELGAVTVLVHAAGTNEPLAFPSVTDDDLRRVLDPKTAGLRAAVAAAGPRLRRVVTFGSILGRMGLKGESHYALANAWQSAIAEDISRARAECDVLSLEWSIWNGAGMGHRLGSLERLARFGVDAIALDDGIAAFERLVLGGATGTLIVTSRFGPPREVSLQPVDLPILRFVDTPLVHYPGVELVVETELSGGRDPYLLDHAIDGTALMPAVFGLEAMAQVASALTGEARCMAIEGVSFDRAVSIPRDGAARIQILALMGEDGRVEAAIRAEDDRFATDRMHAVFVFGDLGRSPRREPTSGSIELDARPLYDSLFFQGGRFRRVRRYTSISARGIAAQLETCDDVAWFGALEPRRLVLGDAGARDALLHALQAAVPHVAVVPVSVERVAMYAGGDLHRVEAVERHATADTFVFDIFGYDDAGDVVEEWIAATFRAVTETRIHDLIDRTSHLAAPYIERVARELLEDDAIEVALVSDAGAPRAERRRRALCALDLAGQVVRRSDGKPIMAKSSRGFVSLAHGAGMTLAVKAAREIGCDFALVRELDAAASDAPLPPAGRPLAAALAGTGSVSWASAAARFWAVGEVAAKCGRRLDGACRAHSGRGREVVTFDAPFGRTVTLRVPSPQGDLIIAIGAVRLRDMPSPAMTPGDPARRAAERAG